MKGIQRAGRAERAHRDSAQIFVSIHANTVGPEDDPFEKPGFGLNYYQPFSLPLAEAIHSSLQDSIPIRD